ncbi:hypothetical protein PCI56_01125 [Plesiomonas shigelloides subsp. oncorhynchi]|nr:hypothetical protein [Plesiomonas shigelloides]
MDDEEREAVENMREEFVAKATSGECNEEAKQTIEALCQAEPDELDRQFIALLSASRHLFNPCKTKPRSGLKCTRNSQQHNR